MPAQRLCLYGMEDVLTLLGEACFILGSRFSVLHFLGTWQHSLLLTNLRPQPRLLLRIARGRLLLAGQGVDDDLPQLGGAALVGPPQVRLAVHERPDQRVRPGFLALQMKPGAIGVAEG